MRAAPCLLYTSRSLDVRGSCDCLQSQTDLDLLLSLRHEGRTELVDGLTHILQVVLEAQALDVYKRQGELRLRLEQ